MEGLTKLKRHSRFAVIAGIIIAVMLLALEIIVDVEYIFVATQPPAWSIALLIVCEILLDALCFVEIFVNSFKIRIAIYSADFTLLLAISVLSGSPYISALYCVILSEVYLNVQDFKSKLWIFISSCIGFILTSLIGWVIKYRQAINYAAVISIASDGLLNIMFLFAHFAVANFLISFYKTNKKLTAALKESDENKKMLEQAYEQLSETAVFEERNRIARDIHDNAGHSMTAVIMQTEAAKLIIDSDPEEAKNKIISANIQAKNALEQMRESVHLLAGRNASVTLKEEIEEIIAQTMDGTDVIIRYDITDISMPYDKRRFIANSLKECLANGMRHGGANAFYVELTLNDNVVKLTVSDNGTGLPSDFKEGFGLRGLREKAAKFGGGIVLESEEGEGTELTVSLPLHDKENKQ